MTPSSARIVQMASAFQESCLLFAASDLGIFTHLDKTGPATAGDVARALGLDERGVALLMNACVAIRLLEKHGAEYENSPEAAMFLVTGQPGDLSAALRYNRDVYAVWGRVAELARAGGPVERPELHLGEDPARTRAFVMSMHGKALAMAHAVLRNMDLAGRKRLLDVGGGPGTFSVLLSKKYPSLHCTVLELTPIAAVGRELIQQQGASRQVDLLPGDYHTTPFPSGNDAVLLFGMLHQEPEDVVRSLLGRAFAALNPGGEVYILDMMTDETHTNPPFSAMFAVNMALTKEHGWVFSDRELKNWMAAAGFVENTVEPLPPPIPHWLAKGKKP